MAVHKEFVVELREMAKRLEEMHKVEKSSSDARYALRSAHQYILKAARSLETMSE